MSMIPLADASRRPKRFPVVTAAIILLNAIVFLFELLGGEPFVKQWSVIPADIVSGQHWVTIISAMFMHGGWMHIIGNMVFLKAFGPEIEDAMGRLRYLAFYLLSGVAASLAQIVAMPNSTVPNLGRHIHPHNVHSRRAADWILVSHSNFQSGRRRGKRTGGGCRLCGSCRRLHLRGGFCPVL